jgi:hypothetical protein
MELLDYRLPNNWSGVKLYSKLRSLIDYDLPAVLLTGDTATDELCEVSESGLHVLHKPVDISRLHELIMKTVLASH